MRHGQQATPRQHKGNQLLKATHLQQLYYRDAQASTQQTAGTSRRPEEVQQVAHPSPLSADTLVTAFSTYDNVALPHALVNDDVHLVRPLVQHALAAAVMAQLCWHMTAATTSTTAAPKVGQAVDTWGAVCDGSMSAAATQAFHGEPTRRTHTHPHSHTYTYTHTNTHTHSHTLTQTRPRRTCHAHAAETLQSFGCILAHRGLHTPDTAAQTKK